MVDALAETARLADRLAPGFEAASAVQTRARLVVVEGAPGAGKTTALAGLAEALRARGLAVGGVLQPALGGGEEAASPGAPRPGYDLEDLASGERRRFARRREGGARGYDFDDDAWAWAAARFARAQRGSDVVVVDELGRLEADGGGHVPGLAALTESPGRAAVLLGATRDGCVEPLATHVGPPALALAAPLDGAALEAAADEIARLAAETRLRS
jgi:nucleoside-triphosphatase THEP1